jgi:hypothetical protein
MPSLVDITPLTIEVAGVPIKGISGRSIGVLLSEFPILRKIMADRAFDAKSLIEVAPDAVAAVIAAGIGKPGDKKEQAAADALPIGTQIEMLAAIFKVSFPNGLSAAVEVMTQIAQTLPGAADPDPTAPASK